MMSRNRSKASPAQSQPWAVSITGRFFFPFLCGLKTQVAVDIHIDYTFLFPAIKIGNQETFILSLELVVGLRRVIYHHAFNFAAVTITVIVYNVYARVNHHNCTREIMFIFLPTWWFMSHMVILGAFRDFTKLDQDILREAKRRGQSICRPASTSPMF